MKEQSSSETQRALLCFILPWLVRNRSRRLCCELTAMKGCSGAWLKATASSCSSVIKTQRNPQKIEGLILTSHLKPPWQSKDENKLYSSNSSVNELWWKGRSSWRFQVKNSSKHKYRCFVVSCLVQMLLLVCWSCSALLWTAPGNCSVTSDTKTRLGNAQ